MSGEAFTTIGLFSSRIDEAIQLMSEHQVNMELEGCPLSPAMTSRFDEIKRQFCHFAGLLQAVNYLISGDAGEDSFDETAKEEEEYRLSNIMPMEEVRERVKKMIAKDGYYHR